MTWPVAIGAFMATCALLEVVISRAVRKHAAKTESDVSALVREQRVDDGLKFIQGWRGEMPVDVKRVTVILHYDDGKSLTMECRPEQMMKAQL